MSDTDMVVVVTLFVFVSSVLAGTLIYYLLERHDSTTFVVRWFWEFLDCL